MASSAPRRAMYSECAQACVTSHPEAPPGCAAEGGWRRVGRARAGRASEGWAGHGGVGLSGQGDLGMIDQGEVGRGWWARVGCEGGWRGEVGTGQREGQECLASGGVLLKVGWGKVGEAGGPGWSEQDMVGPGGRVRAGRDGPNGAGQGVGQCGDVSGRPWLTPTWN